MSVVSSGELPPPILLPDQLAAASAFSCQPCHVAYQAPNLQRSRASAVRSARMALKACLLEIEKHRTPAFDF